MSIITKEILSGITENLVKEFSPRKIYLFGSHAWGKPNKATLQNKILNEGIVLYEQREN
ncbi:MAG: hypothetical protein HZB41_10565 [Ignavibacteriae bacterium]|nr:hypothetical protein [Ignavibacteriota bacterium]